MLYVCEVYFFRYLHLSSFVPYAWPLEFNFSASYAQILYLCFMCGCWEFAWYIQLTYFCLVCCWWLFIFRIVFLTTHFVIHVWEIWFFCFLSRYLNLSFLCYMRGRWEYFFYMVFADILLVLHVWLPRIFSCCVLFCS